MGSYYTVPYKDRVHSGIIIVDSESNNLAFVSTAMRESDPLEESTYRKQMEDLMKKFRK
jgi:hypothetical protein